jgi:hypothetical protein
MKNMSMLGVVLIVLGVAALFFSHVTFTETKPAVRLGPLEINTQENHTIWIPTVAGIVILLAGVGLIASSRRSS